MTLKVLLTGGAGFIGSHVAEQLVSQNFEVVIIDNLTAGSTTYLPDNIKVYQLNINDPSVETIFKIEKPDVVIHLAAQTSVIKSMNEPYFDFETNTLATVKLLSYSTQNHVKQFIFASSAAIYGETVSFPISEEHPLDPQSFYAASKYAAERYVHIFAQQNGFTSTVLRFSNVYGPRQNTASEAGVIGLYISTLLRGESCIIFGGSQTRDFIYVKDIAKACVDAVTSRKSGNFNISSNVEYSIEKLYDLISEKMGVDTLAIYKPSRNGEVIKSILSNAKSERELGWFPIYSISQGLDETIDYFSRKFKDGMKGRSNGTHSNHYSGTITINKT